MTSKLLIEYKQRIKGLKLIPSSGGCFELSLDGELIYSKLSTGKFPDETSMVQEVGKRLAK
ncbi:MAG: SelT/SelW/SelH family protein [Gemmataceae bacterium]|nr:SelT/SelW/SelH family protein [Gemmataceae bacterium]